WNRAARLVLIWVTLVCSGGAAPLRSVKERDSQRRRGATVAMSKGKFSSTAPRFQRRKRSWGGRNVSRKPDGAASKRSGCPVYGGSHSNAASAGFKDVGSNVNFERTLSCVAEIESTTASDGPDSHRVRSATPTASGFLSSSSHHRSHIGAWPMEIRVVLASRSVAWICAT